MSEFVPLQKSSSFQAGILNPGDAMGEPSSEFTAAVDEAEPPTDDSVQDRDESEAVLPATIEELEAVLDEVRSTARSDAEGALETVREALQAERDQLVRLRDKIESSRSAWAEEVRNMLGELVVVGVDVRTCQQGVVRPVHTGALLATPWMY